ncbi:uncharacterized protein LOC106164254 [Lingula anatina]|uniref:Uncharacterized protein LOC106164254 n=1 Tax=Lingula anatina TaxID=7574 RepID=A0A1S3IH26_LINAN|nr:uncharacterized protein LOC106164254 [Lingula anatina]|eukprot:XP_013397560.1 uncharacterized protein LOC106164254 [Lingula anatina]
MVISGGVIAGIVVAVLVVIGLMVASFLCGRYQLWRKLPCLRKRRDVDGEHNDGFDPESGTKMEVTPPMAYEEDRNPTQSMYLDLQGTLPPPSPLPRSSKNLQPQPKTEDQDDGDIYENASDSLPRSKEGADILPDTSGDPRKSGATESGGTTSQSGNPGDENHETQEEDGDIYSDDPSNRPLSVSDAEGDVAQEGADDIYDIPKSTAMETPGTKESKETVHDDAINVDGHVISGKGNEAQSNGKDESRQPTTVVDPEDVLDIACAEKEEPYPGNLEQEGEDEQNTGSDTYAPAVIAHPAPPIGERDSKISGSSAHKNGENSVVREIQGESDDFYEDMTLSTKI